MTTDPLRLALVGAGGIGKTHRNAWSKVPNAQIVAVVDVDSDRASAMAAELKAESFTDSATMLSATKPDAVDVCTPPAMHRPVVEVALAAGVHVICEKPLADTPPNAFAIVEAAEASGKLLMAAFCHRFHPPVARLKQLIDAGALGRLGMFRNRFAGPFVGIEDVWFSNPDISGGGCLMDTSVHSVDLFRFLVGEVKRAEGAGLLLNERLRPGIEDTAAILLQSDSGAVGVIEASWTLPGGVNVVEVYGTEGIAEVHYWDGLPSRYKTNAMDAWEPLPEEGDRFVGELTHFAQAVRGEAPLSVTARDGLRAVEVIYEAYASAGLR
jgi:predicted dehydrogenase